MIIIADVQMIQMNKMSHLNRSIQLVAIKIVTVSRFQFNWH